MTQILPRPNSCSLPLGGEGIALQEAYGFLILLVRARLQWLPAGLTSACPGFSHCFPTRVAGRMHTGLTGIRYH